MIIVRIRASKSLCGGSDSSCNFFRLKPTAPATATSDNPKILDILDQALAVVNDSSRSQIDLGQTQLEPPSYNATGNLFLAAIASFMGQKQAAFRALSADSPSPPLLPEIGFIWAAVFQPLRNELGFLELTSSDQTAGVLAGGRLGRLLRPERIQRFRVHAVKRPFRNKAANSSNDISPMAQNTDRRVGNSRQITRVA
jgi:hypothetical protein